MSSNSVCNHLDDTKSCYQLIKTITKFEKKLTVEFKLMFWREKTTVPFVFYRSKCMKIVTHSSATALLQCAQMTRTVQLHRPDVYCPILHRHDTYCLDNYIVLLMLKSSLSRIHQIRGFCNSLQCVQCLHFQSVSLTINQSINQPNHQPIKHCIN